MIGIKTIRNALSEIKNWYTLYKATKDAKVEQELKKNGFKVSWLGYPYKVIPIPNEFMESKDTVQNYVWGQLREINDAVTAPLGIAELCYPNLQDIAPATYLVILEPQFESLKWKNIIPILIGWFILGFIGYKLGIKYDVILHLIDLYDITMNFLDA